MLVITIALMHHWGPVLDPHTGPATTAVAVECCAADHGPAGDGDQSTDHSLLHLCLAILAALLLLGLVLLAQVGTPSWLMARGRPRSPPPPRRSSRSTLHSLCVLRL